MKKIIPALVMAVLVMIIGVSAFAGAGESAQDKPTAAPVPPPPPGAAWDTTQAENAQEGPRTPQSNPDDTFHRLTQNGLSVAVCPLPALGQVNITITDGKDVCLARNIGARAAGIMEEIADMKKELTGVTP